MATTEEETAARTVAAVDFLKVTEQAAIASARWLGRGERNPADQAAVDAMRRELGEMPITGTVVIGEGQKDEAPELYAGEVLGRGGMRCEIAVDPLEGTDLVARGDIGAVAICAIGEPGGIMSAPDIYMQKLVVGATAKGRVSIEAPIAETLEIVALWYGRRVQDLTTIILDRPRHEELIDEIRAAGARIRLIPDGDITASLSVAVSGTGDHLYAGMGGSTRASSRRRRSSASRRDPGQDGPARRGRPPQDGRFRHGQPGNGADDPRPRPRALYVIATGVTDGGLLKGVRYFGDGARTHSIVMDLGGQHGALHRHGAPAQPHHHPRDPPVGGSQ